MTLLGLNKKSLINASSSSISSVCLLSYNSRGFCSAKQEFCKLITSAQTVGSALPILCNQENFVLRNNAYRIKNTFPGFHLVIKPAVKVDTDNGRPKNGMFMAIPNIFRDIIVDISPDFWRVQAAVITIRTTKLLLINSYFPVDPKTNIADDAELIETLQNIRTILLNNKFHHVIWAGDINSDFLRNTNHVSVVSSFLQEFSLLLSWDNFSIDFTHEYELNGNSFVSTVDHFFWNNDFHESVLDCGVIHHISNLSDHSPIYCKFSIDDFKLEDGQNIHPYDQESLIVPKPCWKRSADEQKENFIELLKNKLNNISIPQNSIDCHDPHCNNVEHIENIDCFVTTILETIDHAAEETLTTPVCKSNFSKSNDILPGWNLYVRPFKENAVFWHSIWTSAGRPINNNLHKIMKHTRNLYHYNLRKCKKSKDQI